MNELEKALNTNNNGRKICAKSLCYNHIIYIKTVTNISFGTVNIIHVLLEYYIFENVFISAEVLNDDW